MADCWVLAKAIMDTYNREIAPRKLPVQVYLKGIEALGAAFYYIKDEDWADPEDEEEPKPEETPELVADPSTAVQDDYIQCCVCGKKMKVLSRAHLHHHGLTPSSYKNLCGYAQSMPLCCKQFGAMRKNIAHKVKPWEAAAKKRRSK